MQTADELRRFPARERWFWLGVGFVVALGVLLLGLALAVTLGARGRRNPVTAQSAVHPVQRIVKSAPKPHPAPRTKPAVGIAHPKRHVPQVRVVERLVPNKAPALSSQAAPASSTAPPFNELARPGGLEAPRKVTLPEQPPSPKPDRVAGDRHEWHGAPGPGDRAGTSATSAESGSTTTPPRLLTSRKADYPTSAMEDGVTGKVRLRLGIGLDGFVDHVGVTRSSGDARLDAAAARAALTWRYRPAQQNGRSVAGADQVEFEFFRHGGR
jgi:TonB family protein